MKEALIILLVVFALAALTAVRYRRQIVAVVRVWRMLKAARSASQRQQQNADELGTRKDDVALVNCAKCGAWVASEKAVKLNAKTYICGQSCMRTEAPFSSN